MEGSTLMHARNRNTDTEHIFEDGGDTALCGYSERAGGVSIDHAETAKRVFDDRCKTCIKRLSSDQSIALAEMADGA